MKANELGMNRQHLRSPPGLYGHALAPFGAGMAWLRTIVNALTLVALLASICAVGSTRYATAADPTTVAAAAASEPCPASHGPRQCESKALPSATLLPGAPLVPDETARASVPVLARGVWPKVEPDPPRP